MVVLDLDYPILKRFMIMTLTIVVLSAGSLLSGFNKSEAVNDMSVVLGSGEGTLSCANDTEYEATISFNSNRNPLNGERFGNLELKYMPQNNIQTGSISGVFNNFGSNFAEEQYKLRTEFESNICSDSNLLYLGDISGECGEDVTINLDGGYYLTGTFQGTVTCNPSEFPLEDICDDKIDNNSNGQVDEGCILQPLPQPPEDSDALQPIGIINKIHDLLNKILEQYEVGNHEEANNLVKITYQANFESIKDEIEKHNEELVKNIEENLRERLRQSITEKVPLQEIQQLIGELNNNLNRAQQLLSQESNFITN